METAHALRRFVGQCKRRQKSGSRMERADPFIAAMDKKRPKSITPRVALAELYINYAWQARGQEYADKVTDDNFRLFEERIAMAKATLDEAADLKEKCPQWYNSMQSVALGQAWSKAQAAKLFEEAIAFEPGYYYFY